MPNRDAMSWFVREIFPLIVRQVPEAVMNVIGSMLSPCSVLTPIEMVARMVSPSYSNGSLATIWRSSSATWIAPWLSVSGSTTANSSPP